MSERSLFKRTFCNESLTAEHFKTFCGKENLDITVNSAIRPSNLKGLLGSIKSDLIGIFLPKYDLSKFLESSGDTVKLPKGRFIATKTIKLHRDVTIKGQGVFTQLIADNCTLFYVMNDCLVTLSNVEACGFAGSHTKLELRNLYSWLTRKDKFIGSNFVSFQKEDEE